MRISPFASSAALLLALHASATAGGRCDAFLPVMKGGELYVADAACAAAACLQHVTAAADPATGYTDVPLKQKTTYSFFYKTNETGVVNSLVAVQIKNLGVDRRPSEAKPVGVNLERDATPFACSAPERVAYRYRKPTGEDDAIDYDAFDRFHRWGSLSTPDDAILHEQFHIYYDNGVSWRCMRSDDDYRAPLLLMHGRDAVPGPAEKISYRLGVTAIASQLDISAFAQTPSQRKEAAERSDIAPFSQLKILLTNYQKKKYDSGCFSFSASTGLADPNKQSQELDISFSDLEDAAPSYPMAKWYAQTIFKFAVK